MSSPGFSKQEGPVNRLPHLGNPDHPGMIAPMPEAPETHVLDRPVDMESGRKLYGQAREILAEFRDSILPGIELGQKTRGALIEVLGELLDHPDGVLVFDHNRGRFAAESTPHFMEISPGRVDEKARFIADAARRSGVQLNESQHKELAVRSLVYHELGHALQTAYAQVAAPFSRLSGGIREVAYPKEASLTRDAVRWGLTDPLFDDPDLFDRFADRVDSERLPVGLEQMLAAQYAEHAYGLSTVDAESLRIHLTSQVRVEAAQVVRPIIAENATQIKTDSITVDDILTQKIGPGIGVKVLGYAAPYSPEAVRKILAATAQWEDLSGDDRYYPEVQTAVRRWRQLQAQWERDDLPIGLPDKGSGRLESLGVHDVDVAMLFGSGPARKSFYIQNQAEGDALMRAATALAAQEAEPIEIAEPLVFARSFFDGQFYLNVDRPKRDHIPETLQPILVAALAGRLVVRVKILCDPVHIKDDIGRAFVESLGPPAPKQTL